MISSYNAITLNHARISAVKFHAVSLLTLLGRLNRKCKKIAYRTMRSEIALSSALYSYLGLHANICMFTMELAYIQTWPHRDTSFCNFFFTTVEQIKLESLQRWFVKQLILMKTLTFFKTVASVFTFPLLSAC